MLHVVMKIGGKGKMILRRHSGEMSLFAQRPPAPYLVLHCCDSLRIPHWMKNLHGIETKPHKPETQKSVYLLVLNILFRISSVLLYSI